MTYFDDNDYLLDTICAGCELPAEVDDVGLCTDCAAKLDRDMIRARDWDYSATAFVVPDEQREALRDRVIREHGTAFELIAPPSTPKTQRPKRTRSRERKRKAASVASAIRDYDTEAVLQAAKRFIQTESEEWVNFSRVSQHLHERFYKVKPKQLGHPGKRYKSLLKLLADYPQHFELRQDASNRSVFWIRLAAEQEP